MHFGDNCHLLLLGWNSIFYMYTVFPLHSLQMVPLVELESAINPHILLILDDYPFIFFFVHVLSLLLLYKSYEIEEEAVVNMQMIENILVSKGIDDYSLTSSHNWCCLTTVFWLKNLITIISGTGLLYSYEICSNHLRLSSTITLFCCILETKEVLIIKRNLTRLLTCWINDWTFTCDKLIEWAED